MNELHDVITALTDADGSCRDINFDTPTWEGVDALLSYLNTSYQTAAGSDSEGRPLYDQNPQVISAAVRDSGAVHIVYEGGANLINHLQLLVYREPDGSPFVELTFFPQDVCQTPNLRSEFITWADQLHACVGASRYYARYEDAPWRFGDVSATSGVFLVSD